MSEKKVRDLEMKKEEDLRKRRLRIKIRTEIDNAITAFMYAVESHDIEVEKAAEDYLIEYLFNQDMFDKCEEAIEAEKKKFGDLINSSRKVAEAAVKLTKEERKTSVSRSHLENAIKSLQSDCWPYCQVTLTNE